MGHGDTNVRKAVENGTALDASGIKFAIPGHGSVRFPCAPAGPKIDASMVTAVLMDATILLLHIFSGMKDSGTSVRRIARIFHDNICKIRRVYPDVRIIELFADVTDRTPLTKSIEQQARAGVRKKLDSEQMRVLRESDDGTIAAADAVYATKCKEDKGMDARTVIFERMVPFLEMLGTEAVLDGFQHHGDTGGRMCAYDLCTKTLRETHFNGENDTRMVRRAHELFLEGESVLICSTDTDMYAACCLNAFRDHPDVTFYRENPLLLAQYWERVQETGSFPEEGRRSRLFMNRAPAWPTDALWGKSPSPYENRFIDLCVMYSQLETTGTAESAYAYMMWGGNDLCKSGGEHVHHSSWKDMEAIIRPLLLNMALIRAGTLPTAWPGKLPVCVRVTGPGEAEIDERAMIEHVCNDSSASLARVRRVLLSTLYYTVYPWMTGDVRDCLNPFGEDSEGVTIYGFHCGHSIASYSSVVSLRPPVRVSCAGLTLGEPTEEHRAYFLPASKKRKAEQEPATKRSKPLLS